MAKTSPLLIGTSGFSYADWKEDFYPKGTKPPDRLAHFVTRFNTVEINMTFYRPVAEKTLLNWLEVVPKNFAFTMKAGKPITHYRRLRHCRSLLRDLWEQFSPLGKHLSCVLFQLPPSLKPDLDLLRSFLEDAHETRDREGLDHARLAIEFRSRRWYEPEVFALLKEYKDTAPVLHDMPYKGGFWPIIENDDLILKSGHLLLDPGDWLADATDNFLYMRFHGTVNKKPWQEYPYETLELWERAVRRYLEKGKPFYAYLNNDGHAAATRNAAQLQEMLAMYGKTGPSVSP
jgi:uncharacterized protein YecE (DUF72 family)